MAARQKPGVSVRGPFAVALGGGGRKPESLFVKPESNDHSKISLGAIDAGVRVGTLPPGIGALFVVPLERAALTGIDPITVRMFRWDPAAGTLVPIWNSGINTAFGFAWAKVAKPGSYVPVGLPRDRVLQETLRLLAYERRMRGEDDAKGAQELTQRFLKPWIEEGDTLLREVRQRVAQLEVAETGVGLRDFNVGQGGHPEGFHLPKGEDLKGFRKRLQRLGVGPRGLPEEELFHPPEICPDGDFPWPAPPEEVRLRDFELQLDRLGPKALNPAILEKVRWLFSKDWPMYQHDIRHSGRASGISSLTSTTVGQLRLRFKVDLDGPVNTKPSIVGGRVYVGTTKSGGTGGTLYKINQCSGVIEGRFPTSGTAYYPISGIGGSPSVYKGKAYFTTVYGKVYCVDTATMTPTAPHPAPLWVTDLKNSDSTKKQPVNNPSGDCWTSALVVNDRVYVGSGEGEVSNCWGFVWCLDANTGEVLWLFCTNKRQNINTTGSDNQPNQIPRSAAVSDPLPAWATAAGFNLMDDPPETGSSPWSSFAYDAVLNRVYVGTGNSEYVPSPPQGSTVPDQRYGSGLLSLDATTGEFRGFHAPQSDDSYFPNDADVDVPGSPTIFARGSGERVVCYGSKNGSFWLLDPDTMQVLGGGAQRRQLLARQSGSGHPGNRGTAIATVVPTSGAVAENKWGVMATPAVHAGLGIIYAGLGGYVGAGDGSKSPFVRALNWNTLDDAWPTAVVGGVTKYTVAQPPVYVNSNEAALSSPAVVNDVVFVSTTDPAHSEMGLYALDAATGLCLWSASKVSGGGWPNYALGPAISGEYVVAGAGNSVHIYTRPGTPWCPKWPIKFPFPIEVIPPWPWPWPGFRRIEG